MPKIPQIKPREVENVLIKHGFKSRPTKSSHVFFFHSDGRTTTVPVHTKPMSTGTLRAILRQSKISVDEFLKEI